MTRLLVSVRSADEAEVALACGVDLIDVKEPRFGSLGAAKPHVWREVADRAGTCCPLSLALGELREFVLPEDPMCLVGYTYGKLGLAGCVAIADWKLRWQSALQSLSPWVTPVAAAYADYRFAQSPPPAEICNLGKELGCRALLIDTYSKAKGDVFSATGLGELTETLRLARSLGMATVLAGSLSVKSLDQALSLKPDILAVRGAVCRGTRGGDLDTSLVREWVERCHEPRPFAVA